MSPVRRAVIWVVVLGVVIALSYGGVWVLDRLADSDTAAPTPTGTAMRSTPNGSTTPTSAQPSPRPSAARPTTTLPTAKPTTARPTAAKPKPSTAKPKPSTTKPLPAGVPRRPKDAQQLTVTYVYDGDTLQLKASKKGRYVTKPGQFKVRLIGVNAPEMTPKKECYAQQATDRLRVLAKKGSTVWVAPDSDSWDDYKRRLFYVWTADGRMLDYELVAGGYGRALRIWPNVKHAAVMEQAEKKAKAAKKGLWKAC